MECETYEVSGIEWKETLLAHVTLLETGLFDNFQAETSS